jgi:hypothetical protein
MDPQRPAKIAAPESTDVIQYTPYTNPFGYATMSQNKQYPSTSLRTGEQRGFKKAVEIKSPGPAGTYAPYSTLGTTKWRAVPGSSEKEVHDFFVKRPAVCSHTEVAKQCRADVQTRKWEQSLDAAVRWQHLQERKETKAELELDQLLSRNYSHQTLHVCRKEVHYACKEGQRVEAECGQEGVYAGTVERVRGNGTFDINFDDGDREKQVTPGRIRCLL